MKNRKGFTLIELLAVIVVLAVIMVIAVPKILDVIESSRESAVNSSIKLVKDAIKMQITTASMSGVTFVKDEKNCYEFDFSNKNTNVKNLNVKNKENVSGKLQYCLNINSENNNSNGKFYSSELKVDGYSPTISDPEIKVTRIDIINEVINGNYETGNNITVTVKTDDSGKKYLNLFSPFAGNGRLQYNKDLDKYKVKSIYIKGHRNSSGGNSNYRHFYLSGFATYFPSAGEDFEYSYELKDTDGLGERGVWIEFCLGDFDITEFYFDVE